MRLRSTIALLVSLCAVAVAIAIVYVGAFNVATDSPHAQIVYGLLEIVRERSVAVRASKIQVPSLADPQLVAAGARDYADMCTDCHLAPGAEESEMRKGLYPKPPDLSKRVDASAAEMFWTIKHGIKMSAMPAWGVTHDDQRIWGMVAFLQKLPALSPQEYEELTVGMREATADHQGEKSSTTDHAAEPHRHAHHHHRAERTQQ